MERAHNRPVAAVWLGLAALCLSSVSTGCSTTSHALNDGSVLGPPEDAGSFAGDAAAPGDDAATPLADAGDAAAPGEDAATPLGDAGPTGDGSVGPLSIGAASVVQRISAMSPATGTLTTSPSATLAGSVLLSCIARGTWSSAPDAPTDNRGNTFVAIDATHPYIAFATSRTGLYRVLGATGGADHTFSMSWGPYSGGGDEATLSAVEVLGATSIEASSWIERTHASSITSASVTTSGPAILVAWWWGSGGVRPVGSKHIAVPGDGFTIVPSATALTSLSAAGYIQVAVAYRVVPAAGTYSVTWTTDDEGAQLYLVALRGN